MYTSLLKLLSFKDIAAIRKMSKPSSMVIYVNGRFLTQPRTGVQRFALEILNSHDKAASESPGKVPNIQFICLVPPNTQDDLLPKWQTIKIKRAGRLTGNLWEQMELPFLARRGLLLSLCNIGPLMHFDQVVIFHDASVFAVPQAYSLPFKIKYRVIMWVLARTARQVLTDSQFSQGELAHYLRINKEKIEVMPGGCDHILAIEPDESILADHRLAQTPFLLAVGSSSPHKNLAIVVKAIEKSPDYSYNLVIAGGTYSKVFNAVESIESERIIRLGYVTDAQLRALYSQAVGFIFPSIYEGFGLPPLEAMACGCPVLSSNRASLPEVCGNAALYFDPMDVKGIGRQITQFMNDSTLRDSLKEKGFVRAKQYTWEKAAIMLFNTIIKQHHPLE